MRIVHLNPFYFPYAGGIERRLRATGRLLAQAGHDVHVVTAQLPGTSAGTEDDDGITVHRLPSRFPLRSVYNPPPVTSKGIVGTIRRIEPDVVDYHFRWSRSYNGAARTIAKETGLVVTYHNTYGEGTGLLRLLSLANDRLFMRTLRQADRVVAVSGFLRDQLEEKGIEDDRLAAVPNGIDVAPYDAVAGEPEQEVGRPYVVGLGRLVKLKAYDLAVRALRYAPSHVHLVLVGKGPEKDRLVRLAGDLGLGDRVHATGWVSEDEKIRLLKGAAALVHPARFEAFGLGVLEAMACSTPVIAAEVGGLPEVVGDGGILLNRDPRAWGAAIGRVVRDGAERGRMAQAARSRAETFSWDRTTDALVEVYQEAADA